LDQENVAFANPGFNTNGRQQNLLPPTLQFQTYTTQQNSTAQARVDNAFQLEDTFAWFVLENTQPRGQVRRAVRIRSAPRARRRTTGTAPSSSRRATRRSMPPTAHVSGQLLDPSAGPLNQLREAQYLGAFAQDKWQISSRLTASLGIPLRPGEHPTRASMMTRLVCTARIRSIRTTSARAWA